MNANKQIKHYFQIFFAKILVNSVIHPFFGALLAILMIIENLIVLQGDRFLKIFNLTPIDILNNNTLIIIIFIFQIIFLTFLLIGIIIQCKSTKQSINEQKVQKNYVKFIRRATCDLLTIIRMTLILPFTYVNLKNLLQPLNQSSTLSFSISIINIIIFYLIIYPICGLIYYNKIVRKQGIISYAYLINPQSIIFVYFPTMITIQIFIAQMLPYVNLMFWLISIVLVYFHPIVSFSFDRTSRYCCISIQSAILLSSMYTIFSIQLNSIGNWMFFVTIQIIIALLVYKISNQRLLNLLRRQSSLSSKDNFWTEGQDQSLFFHLIDLNKNKSQLLFFLFNLNHQLLFKNAKTQKQVTISKPSNANNLNSEIKNINSELKEVSSEFKIVSSQKSIGQVKQNQNKIIINRIFELLKNNRQSQNEFQQLFYELIFQNFRQKYDPERLLLKNLGTKQIIAEIMHNPKIYLFISQILLLKKSCLRKSYFFIKAHQKILNDINQFSFISGIQIYSILLLISQKMEQEKKLQKQYNQRAQFYLNFHTKFERLKGKISKSAKICLQFWQQINEKQPDVLKANRLIEQNSIVSSQIQSIYQQIIVNYQRQSPLVLFETVIDYCQVILNNKIPSLLNPFNNLITRAQQQIEIQKIQGISITKKNQINYSILQIFPFCIVDMDNNIGKIAWANTNFWAQIYHLGQKNYQQHQIKSILNVMPKQIIANHQLKYFKQFSQSQNFKCKHQNALIFDPNDRKIQQVLIDMQLLPSLNNGLKLSMFFNKKILQNQHFLDLVINQNSQFVAWSQSLAEQSSQMFQGIYNYDVDLYNQPYRIFYDKLFKLQDFTKFLQQISYIKQSNDTHQDSRKHNIKYCLKLQNSDYNISLKSKFIYSTENQYITKNINENRYLIHIQFQNVANIAIQSGKTIDQYQLSQNSKSQKKNHFVKDNNDINSLFASIFTGIIPTIQGANSQFTEFKKPYEKKQLELPFEILDKIEQKSQTRQINDKKYASLIGKKTPSQMKTWQIFTVGITIFMISAMVSNIGITIYRGQIYISNNSLIQNFSQLTTMMAKTIITLRDYNYYVSIFGVDEEHVPSFQNQLQNQQAVISETLSKVSGLMTDTWDAFESLITGQLHSIEQNSYIVISTYVLSAMTQISQVQFKEMSFPILTSMYYWWDGISVTQSSFQQAVFNGVYVCMINLNRQRDQILENISLAISPILTQLFIFPSIFGLTLLILFAIYSINIELKSQKLKKQVFQLFEGTSMHFCDQKRLKIQEFINQKSQFNINQRNQRLKDNFFVYFQKTFGLFADQFVQPKIQHQNIVKSKNLKKKQNIILQNQNLAQSDTVREFFQTQQNEEQVQRVNQASKRFIQTLKNMSKTHSKQSQKKQIQQKYELVTSVYIQCSIKRKIVFYFLISLPFLTYFIFMFVEGVIYNNKVFTYFSIGSKLYRRQSNIEYIFVWTQSTALYQQVALGKTNWTQLIQSQIQSTYRVQKQFKALLSKMDKTSLLLQFTAKIQNVNICEKQLSKFGKSVYYGITFSREQCLGLSQSIMTAGFRPLYSYYIETAISLLQQYPNPGALQYSLRLKYLASPQIKLMKQLLAYLEQLCNLSNQMYQIDMKSLFDNYIQMTIIYSIVTAVMVLFIFVSIYYRWNMIQEQRKQIKSLIQIISYESIKTNPIMLKQFQKIQSDLFQ